jgi:hypothetical protein
MIDLRTFPRRVELRVHSRPFNHTLKTTRSAVKRRAANISLRGDQPDVTCACSWPCFRPQNCGAVSRCSARQGRVLTIARLPRYYNKFCLQSDRSTTNAERVAEDIHKQYLYFTSRSRPLNVGRIQPRRVTHCHRVGRPIRNSRDGLRGIPCPHRRATSRGWGASGPETRSPAHGTIVLRKCRCRRIAPRLRRREPRRRLRRMPESTAEIGTVVDAVSKDF